MALIWQRVHVFLPGVSVRLPHAEQAPEVIRVFRFSRSRSALFARHCTHSFNGPLQTPPHLKQRCKCARLARLSRILLRNAIRHESQSLKVLFSDSTAEQTVQVLLMVFCSSFLIRLARLTFSSRRTTFLPSETRTAFRSRFETRRMTLPFLVDRKQCFPAKRTQNKEWTSCATSCCT
jgi:hypothetical protein